VIERNDLIESEEQSSGDTLGASASEGSGEQREAGGCTTESVTEQASVTLFWGKPQARLCRKAGQHRKWQPVQRLSLQSQQRERRTQKLPLKRRLKQNPELIPRPHST